MTGRLPELYVLEHAIASLEEALGIVSDNSWFNAQKTAVRNTLISGVILNVGFTYDVGIMMIRRAIAPEAASPAEVDETRFREILRTAAEKGLIANVESWFNHRKMRNIGASKVIMASRTCDHSKMQEDATGFLRDARALLTALSTRHG